MMFGRHSKSAVAKKKRKKDRIINAHTIRHISNNLSQEKKIFFINNCNEGTNKGKYNLRNKECDR